MKTFAACGGTFDAETGEIASPLYPKSYPNNVECVWRIVATTGNRMSIVFQMLDIPPSESCNGDYLEVRENDGSGKVLGKAWNNENDGCMDEINELFI